MGRTFSRIIVIVLLNKFNVMQLNFKKLSKNNNLLVDLRRRSVEELKKRQKENREKMTSNLERESVKCPVRNTT